MSKLQINSQTRGLEEALLSSKKKVNKIQIRIQTKCWTIHCCSHTSVSEVQIRSKTRGLEEALLSS